MFFLYLCTGKTKSIDGEELDSICCWTVVRAQPVCSDAARDVDRGMINMFLAMIYELQHSCDKRQNIGSKSKRVQELFLI